jgi:GTPase
LLIRASSASMIGCERKLKQAAISPSDCEQRIKAIDTRARAELEQMLERRVHLLLFVKERQDWGEDRERFAALGLDYDA